LIGQHSLITRMLKGVFNGRPPVTKYSNFWNVSKVLRYLKGLGENDALSLRLLTIKSAMLMALTRPARSVDLCKLDIRAHSFQWKTLPSRCNTFLNRAGIKAFS